MLLRRKLLLAILIPVLLLGIVGAISIYSLRYLEQAAGQILADNYLSIQETRRMEHCLRMLEWGASDTERSHRTTAARGSLATSVDMALASCEGNVTEPGETEVLARIRASWNELRPRLLAMESSAGAQRERFLLAQSLYTDMEELIALNEQAMIGYERETRRVARLMVGAVTGLVLVAIVALALYALISARWISRPITQVADRLHKALNPTSGEQPPGRGAGVDEIKRLREELDSLLDRLARHEDEQEKRLRHLQGRLAFVMNEVLEGLVLLDRNHRILAVNRVARSILGSGCTEGIRLEELKLREHMRTLLAPLMSNSFHEERDLGEVRHESDGAERIYRPRVLTVSSGHGGIEGYLVLFWDVTEQRRFEESRQRFISMLSHQLKTPMTSLSMSVNLLKERLRDAAPGEAELLSIASENCSSLGALVADLVAASRETAADLSLNPRPVELTRLLRSALRPLVPQAESRGIALVLPATGREVFCTVDPVKFPWVISNIAGNALRYTDRGGKVEVTVEPQGRHVDIRVRDTGVGIAPENLERIFRPYVSLDSEPQPGTHGLGLAIAREIVDVHGGTITAESRLGVGTEFAIRLPALGDQETWAES